MELVRAHAISHVFAQGVPAVDGVSLSLLPGEFVSIVGPSGCGKTTLLNLIAGLLPLQSGEISIAGSPPKVGRADVGYMFARDCLYPWRSALDNVVLGTEFRSIPDPESKRRALELLNRVGLQGFHGHYPKQLSHGMRQRVALARTFSMATPVMLMDEPFGALDAQTKLQLEDLLLDLWSLERRTVLFITHDIAEAIALSDRVVVMSARPGKILADIPVALERPRSVKALQADSAFHELYSRVWAHLELALSAKPAGSTIY